MSCIIHPVGSVRKFAATIIRFISRNFVDRPTPLDLDFQEAIK